MHNAHTHKQFKYYNEFEYYNSKTIDTGIYNFSEILRNNLIEHPLGWARNKRK